MAKITLSGAEFELLAEHFRAPKEGKHVKWREFCDTIEEVFYKKGLEKNIDTPIDDARTQTFYGKTNPNKSERHIADDFIHRFR